MIQEKLLEEIIIQNKSDYRPLSEIRKTDLAKYERVLQELQKQFPNKMEASIAGNGKCMYEHTVEIGGQTFQIKRWFEQVIECDCVESDSGYEARSGRLEMIASTDIEWIENQGFGKFTEFYQCNGCSQVYKITKKILAEDGPYLTDAEKDPEKLTGYEPYNGKLTKKEIMENAPKLEGDIRECDEKRITNRRDKKENIRPSAD